MRIVLLRPSVHVGSQSTGGDYQPNADWTANARDYVTRALKDIEGSLGNTVVEYDEGLSGEGPLVTQYTNLSGSVADSVVQYQFFPGNRLPTKKRRNTFDWGVGPGIAQLKSLQGADYALFISSYDAYGSTGRKMLQLFAAMGGISVTSGVHTSRAGLIDLKTGDLVWMNANLAIGGDIRTPDGAASRVRKLLKGFPGSPTLASTAAK